NTAWWTTCWSGSPRRIGRTAERMAWDDPGRVAAERRHTPCLFSWRNWPRMVRPASVPLICLLALFAGCRGRSDLVGSDVGTKDRELREARERLQQTQVINEALERDLIHGRAAPAVTEESHTGPVAGMKDVVLGRGTGGVDLDEQPGDDALQVVVTPRDEDAS